MYRATVCTRDGRHATTHPTDGAVCSVKEGWARSRATSVDRAPRAPAQRDTHVITISIADRPQLMPVSRR
jgi:hypothetical protein